MSSSVRQLQVGQQLPDFHLPAAGGGEVRISDLRQRENLVLVFIGRSPSPQIRDLLSGLAGRYPLFRQAETTLLVVGHFGLGEAQRLARNAGLPFPVLADEDGRVSAEYAVNDGLALVVADRFGEIYHLFHAGDPAGPPTPQDLLDWVEYIEIQCPE